jgi:hypothetical protein
MLWLGIGYLGRMERSRNSDEGASIVLALARIEALLEREGWHDPQPRAVRDRVGPISGRAVVDEDAHTPPPFAGRTI